MVRHSLRRPLAGLASTLLLAACTDTGAGRGGANRAPAAEVPDSLRYGGTVTIGAYSDLQTMNSLVTVDASSDNIQRNLLFLTLVQYDEKLNPVPALAERWDTARVKPDTLELTFHLRGDVRWHDGRPVTARDVAFTYLRARDPATGYPNASNFTFYDPAPVVVDDRTIRFRFRAHSDFLDSWYVLAPMPEHLLGSVPPAQLANHPFGTQSPVGNGPFRFVQHAAGREWVFEANPDFPKALGGRPYLDRVVYRFVPEQTTLLTELLTGAVDLYMSANPAQAQRITSSPLARLDASAGRQWNWIAWNERRPMFADARVRRALTMAVDRRHVVDALLFGYGTVGRSTVTPAHWSYDSTDVATLIPYDTAGARRLLAEAGWQDRDGDGTLEDASGRPFRFTLKTNAGNQVRKDVVEMVQAQLARIGVQVEPRLVEWNTLNAQMTSPERDFDAIVSSFVDFFRKDDSDILLCRNRGRPYQVVSFCDPAADRMIDSLNVITDRAAAAPLWREYQHLVVQASPFTVLYYPKRLTGLSKRLHGVEMDVRSEFNTIGKWWIAPADRAAAPAPASRDTPKSP
ncbi:MAG TPA: ABC transporter substrate-binding protein [Longimicrobium sp.]|jgi:peptide/nickel transport system substrate-binding protein|nr:ABC transporter substrate-binding protein [Longimicrobium sp.]